MSAAFNLSYLFDWMDWDVLQWFIGCCAMNML